MSCIVGVKGLCAAAAAGSRGSSIGGVTDPSVVPSSDRGLAAGAATPAGGADRELPLRKRIVLIAHDNRKPDMLEWARFNRGTLSRHELYATGTTGGLLADDLGLEIHRFLSGPLGGDQQAGAAIAEGRLDLVIFFWDPLAPHPHDVDVKALLRIAVVHNVPLACNRATADFILSSPLLAERYVSTAPALPAVPL
jgi:methylglyoxal synthase